MGFSITAFKIDNETGMRKHLLQYGMCRLNLYLQFLVVHNQPKIANIRSCIQVSEMSNKARIVLVIFVVVVFIGLGASTRQSLVDFLANKIQHIKVYFGL